MAQNTEDAPPHTMQVIREFRDAQSSDTALVDPKSKMLTAKSNYSVTSAKSVFSTRSRKSVRQPDLMSTSRVLQEKCPCTGDIWEQLMAEKKAKEIEPEVIEDMLDQRETELREEFEQILASEINNLKDRFDEILHNEQVRASYMLREAHRERQEKITALQSQLECKNMAGLMYVMCTERKRSRFEKMKIVEQYTSYINCLQEILVDGQETILRLSRGYKTAAKLDSEWREKMISVVGEFQQFVQHYMGASVDACQYFFNIPELIKTETPIKDNPAENPIDEEPPPPPEHDEEKEKSWWEKLEGDCRPFVIFGDMGEFKAQIRKQTLKHVKAERTAPKRWKEYVFHDMLLKSGCMHADQIKDVFFSRMPDPAGWECQGVQTDAFSLVGRTGSDTFSRRFTTASVDFKGTMGSILKLITGSGVTQTENKAVLLGARDSIELASTTKLKEAEEKKSKPSEYSEPEVKFPIGRRRTSFFEDRHYFDPSSVMQTDAQESTQIKLVEVKSGVEEDESISNAKFRNVKRHDSLEVVAHHVPEKDHNLENSKVCPMEECRRMRMDSFTRALPAYMKAKPFTHIEQTFDGYQTCSPEQLEILQNRLAEKKAKERLARDQRPESPLQEWAATVKDVAVQTSSMSVSGLPPCTCRDESTAASGPSDGVAVNLADLLPARQQIDQIAAELFFDDNLQFNRFKVVGQDSNDSVKPQPMHEPKDFTTKRLLAVKKILKAHPSLCSIFQANAKC